MNGKIKKTLALFLSVLIAFSAFVLPTFSAAESNEADAEQAIEENTVDEGSKDAYDDTKKAVISPEKIAEFDLGELTEGTVGTGDDPLISAADLIREDEPADTQPEGADDTDASLEYIEGEAIVVFKDKMDVKSLENKVTVKDTISFDSKNTGKGLNMAVISDEDLSTEELIGMFEGQENVKYVIPNRLYYPTALTNDPYSNFQWALQNNGHDGGEADIDVNPENIWSKTDSTDAECVIAVIDTGIDLDHEDLKPVLWQNTYDELPGKGNYGYDCAGLIPGGAPVDKDGHGTHVAGIIAAAANNNLGVSGINKSDVKIMALRVQSENGGFSGSAIFKAYEYIMQAKKLGVNVTAVNCSFGGPGTQNDLNAFDEIFDKMGAMGIITCVSAGNEAMNIDQMNYWSEVGDYCYTSPAACKSKYCLTVGATNENGSRASFSCYGTENVDISAPGTSILSTYSQYTFEPAIYNSSTRSKVCSYYQGFNSTMTKSDWFASYYHSNGLTTSQNPQTFFGPSGSSYQIHIGASEAVFGVPFTIDDTTSEYTLTYKMVGTSDCYFAIFDSAQSDSNITGPINDDFAKGSFYGTSSQWNTVSFTIKPESVKGYTKSKNRIIWFYFISESGDSYYLIDDIAFSKQNVNQSQYGKYKFAQGTSMACPYVAGAVGLIANAYPYLSAEEIIDAMKKSAKNIDKLNNYVQGGRFLDLKNISKYVREEVLPTGISVDPPSATIDIDETITLKASVTPTNATDPSVKWSSDKSGIASVSSSGVVTGKSAGTATITAKTVNGLTATCDVTVKEPSGVVMPTDVYLSREAATVPVGVTIPMKAAVFPRNATDQSVTWSSSNTTVAGISSAGVITTKAAGTATITAKTSNGKSATCKITVKNFGGGSSRDISSYVREMKDYIDANYDYYDDDGKNVELSYTLSNGYLLKLYFTLGDDDTLLLYYIQQIDSNVYVHSFFWYDPDNSFDIAPRMIYYSNGDQLFRTYSYTNVRTYDPDIGLSVVYDDDTDSQITDSDTFEASVAIFNLSLTAYDAVMKNVLGFGIYEIGFDNYGEGGSSETEPTGITVSKTSATVNEGQTITLSATVSPSDATDKVVNWSTDDPAIATVSASGVVTGRTAGTTIITAETWNGKSAVCRVTVNGSGGGSDVLLGDADKNSIINVGDATYIQMAIARMNINGERVDYDALGPDSVEFKAADVDRNGMINVGDATLIQMYAAHMPQAQGYGIGEPISDESDQAVIRIYDLEGRLTQTYSAKAGERFTVVTILDMSGQADGLVQTIDGRVIYTGSVLKPTADPDSSFEAEMFPVICAQTDMVANIGVDAGNGKKQILYNAVSTYKRNYHFDSPNAILTRVEFEVTAPGDAEVRNTLMVLALADDATTRIVDNGEIVPGKGFTFETSRVEEGSR